MIKTIEFKEDVYLKIQAEGFASKFAFAFAKEFCKGFGVDVGCNRLEWSFNHKNLIQADNQHIYTSQFSYSGLCGQLKKFQVVEKYDGQFSFPIDPTINGYDATNFPDFCDDLDYVFSSHCLEHIPDYVEALQYWKSKLKVGGVLFLYLPSSTQRYWLPQHNRKHYHAFTPELIKECLTDLGFTNVFASGIDLNQSFTVIGQNGR